MQQTEPASALNRMLMAFAALCAYTSCGGTSTLDSAKTADTPEIPKPSSAADELSDSSTLVTHVAPVKNFSPPVEQTALASVCQNFHGGNVLLVRDGTAFLPSIADAGASHEYDCHSCDCNWLGFNCKTCCRTSSDACSLPAIASMPHIRRTVYWHKIFQVVVDPGLSYSQAIATHSGTSAMALEEFSTSLTISEKASFTIKDLLSFELTASLNTTSKRATSITITEDVTTTNTFTCPTNTGNTPLLFSIWQLHERFDFSDASGTSVWTDPIFRPNPDSAPAPLDNTLSVFAERATALPPISSAP